MLLAWAALGATTAQAQILPGPSRPPALLAYATDTPQRLSEAAAQSSFDGSRRVPSLDCDDNWRFWSCRELFADEGEDRQQVDDGSVVTAERRAGVFPRVDHTHAESWARARSDYGSNRAEAHAVTSFAWTESRVASAWDPTVTSIEGASSGWAIATSLYTEVFTPATADPISLEFVLRQHDTGGSPAVTMPGPYEPFWSAGEGVLEVQVFDLDRIVDYRSGETDVAGPALVGGDSLVRDWGDGAGSSFLQLSLDLAAGGRYALVSRLSVSAFNNARIDMYGTAELERILVAPGQTLGFASGTAYNVSAVPEPAAWASMLAGMTLVAAWVSRRRRPAQA